MATSLLDELPCLLEDADALLSRLSFHLKLLLHPDTATAFPANPSLPDADESFSSMSQTWSSVDPRKHTKTVHVATLARAFGKHVLAASLTPTAMEKLAAMLPPNGSTSLSSLRLQIATVYQLLKNMHHWQKRAWNALTEFFVDSYGLTLDKHRRLTSLLLTTVVKSVKLHLLWSSYPNVSGVLALHAFLQAPPIDPSRRTSSSSSFSARSTLDVTRDSLSSPLQNPEFEAFRTFALLFAANPLIQLQQELQLHPDGDAITTHMRELTLSCLDCLLRCHDLGQLHNQNLVDLVACHRGEYASAGVYQDLLLQPAIAEWVLCVALCLPQHWNASSSDSSSMAPQLWDILQLVVENRLVLAVTRNVTVNVHDLLFQQLQAAIASATALGGTDTALLPLKRKLTKLSKRTLLSAGEKRRERRVLVCWFLRDTVKLLEHNGYLTAPLLPLLLAVCATARLELEWLLAHGAPSSPLCPAHIKNKHLQHVASSYTFVATQNSASELLALYHRLRQLMEGHGDAVAQYYTQFLAHGDADGIAFHVELFVSEKQGATSVGDNTSCSVPTASTESSTEVSAGTDHSTTEEDDTSSGTTQGSLKHTMIEASNGLYVVQMLQNFADRNRFKVLPTAPDFAVWSREWQQLSVYLLMKGNSVPMALQTSLEQACRHADYVQYLPDMLDRVVSFSKCWWHADVLERAFCALIADADTTGNAMAILDVLHGLATGRLPLDELLDPVDEEQVSQDMVHRLERVKLTLGACLERLIDSCVDEERELHAKLSSLDVIDQMRARPMLKDALVNKMRKSSILLGNSKPPTPRSKSSKPDKVKSPLSGDKTSPSTMTMLLLTPGMESRLQTDPDEAVETVASLSLARTHLTALAAALHCRLDGPMQFGQLVERHVKVCVLRFLRGLISLGDQTHSTTSISAIVPVLTCSWRDALSHWYRLLNCIQSLFGGVQHWNQSTLTVVVVSTRNAECKYTPELAVSSLENHQDQTRGVCLGQRVARFYVSLLERQCVTSRTGTNWNLPRLLASQTQHSFVLSPQNRQPSGSDKPSLASSSTSSLAPSCQSTLDPCEYASLGAYSQLYELIGDDGWHCIRSAVLDYIDTQIRQVHACLATDEIALDRLRTALLGGGTETLHAIRAMHSLDRLIVACQGIGSAVFLLDEMDGAISHQAGANNTRWSSSRRYASLITDHAQAGAIWDLLPWAFVASFGSSIWAKSKYFSELDATNTNVHLLATAMAFLLRTMIRCSARTSPANETTTKTDPEAGQEPQDEPLLVQHEGHEPDRETYRQWARIVNEGVLRQRQLAGSLPSVPMLVTAQRFSKILGACAEHGGWEHSPSDNQSRRQETPNEFKHFLPDVVVAMAMDAAMA